MENGISYTFCRTFEVNGRYYCISESRDYDVKYIEPPIIDLEINLVLTDLELCTKEYEFIITNSSDMPIEDFCFELYGISKDLYDSKYIEYYDLNVGESLHAQAVFHNGNETNKIYLGYYIQGISYLWAVDINFMKEESIVLKPVTKFADSIFPEVESVSLYEKVVLEESALPTDITSTTTAEVTITNRQTPIVWALIVIGVLIIGAIVTIVL